MGFGLHKQEAPRKTDRQLFLTDKILEKNLIPKVHGFCHLFYQAGNLMGGPVDGWPIGLMGFWRLLFITNSRIGFHSDGNGKMMKRQSDPLFRQHYEKYKKAFLLAPTVALIVISSSSSSSTHFLRFWAFLPIYMFWFMLYEVLLCSMMFYGVLWCSMMFFDVLWCSLMF